MKENMKQIKDVNPSNTAILITIIISICMYNINVNKPLNWGNIIIAGISYVPSFVDFVNSIKNKAGIHHIYFQEYIMAAFLLVFVDFLFSNIINKIIKIFPNIDSSSLPNFANEVINIIPYYFGVEILLLIISSFIVVISFILYGFYVQKDNENKN